MKVAVVHNFYQQAGGEDVVFRAESNLLSAQGHTVLRYTTDNRQIKGIGRFSLATRAIWNRSVYRELRELFRRERPDIAHFHNTFPLVSPAGYYAARAEGIAVVQTLHNFRMVCPSGLLFRDGHPCEECVGKLFPWPSIVHACYHNSHAATAAKAGMLTLHKPLGTWTRIVGTYIALSEFSRRKFIEGGLPPDKIVVKPNFVEVDPGAGSHLGGYALFVGRLSPEKGVETIIDTWNTMKNHVPLKIVGEGPLDNQLRARAADRSQVQFLGIQPASRVRELMRDAWVLIVPSRWYEGLPLVVLEAFAAGLPVIASDLGNLSALVDHERTGLLFRPGDPNDLRQKLAWAECHSDAMVAMGQRARQVYKERYTASANYRLLMDIYAAAAMH
jgi:glycosyltransferase involved in cell wall biosynthesis